MQLYVNSKVTGEVYGLKIKIMAIRGKNKNPYDELVGFCTVNRIGAKEEMRLRGIIDRIVESKLHQPTVSNSSLICERCQGAKVVLIGSQDTRPCPYCC